MGMNPSRDPSAPERGQPWQRTLYIMFAAQFLSIIGFAFVLPFLPFYIRELGVTDERLVPVWAGVMAASGSLVMAFFSPLWGWLADRHGRKIMVERAMFGGAFVVEDIVRVAVRGLPPHVVAPDLYVLDQDELWLRFWDARQGTWQTR